MCLCTVLVISLTKVLIYITSKHLDEPCNNLISDVCALIKEKFKTL